MVMLLLAVASALGTIVLGILIAQGWADIVAGTFELHGARMVLAILLASPMFLVVFVVEFRKALAAQRADGLSSQWWTL